MKKESDKENAVKFLCDALGENRIDAKGHRLYEFVVRISSDDGWEYVEKEVELESALADYVEKHAEFYEIEYERVPKDMEEYLPKKGETPIDATIPWGRSKSGVKLSEKGGLTRVAITWDDGTMTIGSANCSLKDTFSYAEGRKHAVHRAVRDRVNWIRGIERAKAREKRLVKANGVLHSQLLEEVNVTQQM
jgi:hypothetical protein